MNSSRSLIILLAVTVVAVAAAAFAILHQQASVTTKVERKMLFPDIESKLERVTKLAVKSASGATVVERKDSKWLVPAKHDYPADRAQVRKVLLSFTRMEAAEEKTSKPDLYDRLGLRNVDQKGSKAVLLTLSDASGQAVASLLIGNRAPSRGVYGNGRTGEKDRAYVRKPGEAQSWLAVGVPEVSVDPGKWIDENLLALPRERVKRITVHHPKAPEVTLSRADAGDETFTLADVPKGRKMKSVGESDSAASALSFLSFDDVKPAADVDWSGATEVVFTAFDGLEITIHIKDDWAKFGAAYHLKVAEEGKGTKALPASPPDGKAEAKRLNDRYGAWAYKLPSYKVHDLTPTLKDLTEPVKKAKAN